ncbi:MAG: SAM-dependent chlorinase/fluorinase [Deltaproteobacteria bacterium]|nr:SAM-dependent chlorinase/fluorinase [Deltaproteobacteria bacterium]
MSIITLLTDFGTKDAYAGIMKGVILSVNPSAVIVYHPSHRSPERNPSRIYHQIILQIFPRRYGACYGCRSGSRERPCDSCP